MILTSFQREVEAFLVQQLFYWIPALARGDYFQCLDGEPMSTDHECHSVPKFGRYHLLMYFNKAFPIVRDMVAQVDSMAECIQDSIHVALLQEGYTADEIHEVNTICHIREYIQSDFCLHMVFNHLWLNHPAPLKSINVPVHVDQNQVTEATQMTDVDSSHHMTAEDAEESPLI